VDSNERPNLNNGRPPSTHFTSDDTDYIQANTRLLFAAIKTNVQSHLAPGHTAECIRPPRVLGGHSQCVGMLQLVGTSPLKSAPSRGGSGLPSVTLGSLSPHGISISCSSPMCPTHWQTDRQTHRPR